MVARRALRRPARILTRLPRIKATPRPGLFPTRVRAKEAVPLTAAAGRLAAQRPAEATLLAAAEAVPSAEAEDAPLVVVALAAADAGDGADTIEEGAGISAPFLMPKPLDLPNIIC